MDPRKFDGLVQRLSGALSRRSLVGGSLGASVLAAVGLGHVEVLAKKRVRAEVCIPSGKKCPSKKPRGKKKKKLGCDQCCEGFVVTTTNNKGKRVRKCACKPAGQGATTNEAWQCCSGLSDGSRCVDAAPSSQQCLAVGGTCTTDEQCCSALCNTGASRTGPDADFADECVLFCKSGRARCDPDPEAPAGLPKECCGFRTCVANPQTGTGNVCTSALGEQCIPGAGATATTPNQGTCASDAFLCPVAGSPSEGVCCRPSGRTSGQCGSGSNFAEGCCTGECSVVTGRCCAPNGTDPVASGGTACAPGTGNPSTQVPNESCCSGFCSNEVGATVCGPDATP